MAVTLDRGYSGSAPQGRAVLVVEGRDGSAHLPAGRADQRRRKRLDDGRGESPLAGGGGDLGTDEASPDDHRPRALLQLVANRERVVEGAQRVDALEAVGPGDHARARSCGDDEEVVGDPLVADLHDLLLGVESGRRRAEPYVDAELVAHGLLGAEPRDLRQLSGLVGNAQEGFRQRGSVVGKVLLGADQHDLAVESGLSRRLNGAQAGEGGADDHQSPRVSVGHVRPRW